MSGEQGGTPVSHGEARSSFKRSDGTYQPYGCSSRETCPFLRRLAGSTLATAMPAPRHSAVRKPRWVIFGVMGRETYPPPTLRQQSGRRSGSCAAFDMPELLRTAGRDVVGLRADARCAGSFPRAGWPSPGRPSHGQRHSNARAPLQAAGGLPNKHEHCYAYCKNSIQGLTPATGAGMRGCRQGKTDGHAGSCDDGESRERSGGNEAANKQR